MLNSFFNFLKGRRDQPTASHSSSSSYKSISLSVLKTMRVSWVEASLTPLELPALSTVCSSKEVVLVVAIGSEALNQVFQKPMPAWFG